MGSRDEFKKAVAYIPEHKIKLVVHTVLLGFDKAEEGFKIMKRGGASLARCLYPLPLPLSRF